MKYRGANRVTDQSSGSVGVRKLGRGEHLGRITESHVKRGVETHEDMKKNWASEARWDSEKKLAEQYRLGSLDELKVLRKQIRESEVQPSKWLTNEELEYEARKEYQVSEVKDTPILHEKRGPELHPSPTRWMGH